jgi:ribonuclease R
MKACMARSKKIQDPHAGREASRYDNPIPSREYILQHLEERGKPILHLDLCKELLLFDADSQEALRRRLNAMTRDGQLIENRGGAFGLVRKMDLIKGVIQGNKEGFGFVIPDEGGDDLFLSPNQMRKVFDGDKVLARISGFDKRSGNSDSP